MLGPFATASRRTPIHQVSLAVLSRAAYASMSTTTTTTTTTITTTRDWGDRYGPMEWAQKLGEPHHISGHDIGPVVVCTREQNKKRCRTLPIFTQSSVSVRRQTLYHEKFWKSWCCTMQIHQHLLSEFCRHRLSDTQNKWTNVRQKDKLQIINFFYAFSGLCIFQCKLYRRLSYSNARV